MCLEEFGVAIADKFEDIVAIEVSSRVMVFESEIERGRRISLCFLECSYWFSEGIIESS